MSPSLYTLLTFLEKKTLKMYLLMSIILGLCSLIKNHILSCLSYIRCRECQVRQLRYVKNVFPMNIPVQNTYFAHGFHKAHEQYNTE